MKHLIFSDTHLSHKFEPAKFKFLRKIIFKADKVIIAGDFYDHLFTDLNKLLNSKWQPLFKLLKQKKAVFIPGNHDPLTGTNREKEFCNQITPEYKLISKGKQFIVRHGHKINPGFHKFEDSVPKYIQKLALKTTNKIEKTLVNLFGWVAPYLFSYRYIDILKTINYRRKNKNYGDYLILGHLHFPYWGKRLKYINTGFINHGLASYTTIENGKIKLYWHTYG